MAQHYSSQGMEAVQPGLEVAGPQHKILPAAPNVYDPQSPPPTWNSVQPKHYTEPEGHYIEPQERMIWGMRRKTFFIFFWVVLFLLVGAIIGGSVGGYFAGKNKSSALPSTLSASQAGSPTATATATATVTKSSNPTSTSIPTSTLAVQTGTVTPVPGAQFPASGFLDNICPAADKTSSDQTIGATTYTFQINCGTNYLAGTTAIGGSNATTVDDCLHSCAWHHDRLPGGCTGIVFQGNLTEAEKSNQLANCWIVNSTDNPDEGSSTGTVVGAILTGQNPAA